MIKILLSQLMIHASRLSIPTVSNVNWSAFLEGILLTLLSHNWNNGINGVLIWWWGPKIAPLLTECFCGLLMWHGPLCGDILASWCPNQGVLPLPHHLFPVNHPDIKIECREIQPSVI